MSAHTPGPWPTAWQTERGSTRVYAILENVAAPEGSPHGTPPVRFASVSTDAHDLETRDANARLIAAAPDMLAALQAIAKWIPKSTVAENRHSEHVRAADMVRAAIAAAEGKS